MNKEEQAVYFIERCENCYFFEYVHSECRRYSPKVIDRETGWPNVCLSDWCGEFKNKKDFMPRDGDTSHFDESIPKPIPPKIEVIAESDVR